ARDVVNRTIGSDTCTRLIYQRRQTAWYKRYADLYAAIDKGSQFLYKLDQVTLSPRSFADGLQQYTRTWFRVDQLYRQFIYHARQAEHRTLLVPLLDEIDNYYTNNYLLPLNDQWQEIVDGVTDWHAVALPRQMDFYENYVAPYLRRGKKVFVIISDALRYEVGEELYGRIRQEDRYEANLETAVTALPSFTQLGMAALLPHDTLTIAQDGRTVLVDGQSSAGTANRRKILAQATHGAGAALQANDLLNMSREESRALFRDHEVVYIYHNRIDAAGDKRESEERVFDAVADTLAELIRIIKKLAGANATNMIVTADHGFIYQRRPLDASDFAGQQAKGGQILTVNRRYVLGKSLQEGRSFKRFTVRDVGLDGEMEMLLPKSVNRLRVKGAGSRYVHGGASLQEIIVPVIHINKKRQSDVTKVNVDILRGVSSIITTNQITIRFYQTEPATAKVQPRVLRVGLYTQSGQLISDRHELVFDFSSENEREREIPVQFILTRQSETANGQEIALRLEEQVPGTSHYQVYKSARYVLKRRFGSDFDF
ncbi:MAG TPA: BREX-1 system phosphatase PglZ type A, partial [Anaerolineae bacterium]|nr:BREX-1 system phosphatase PglZ type A [Anaerolineae bacterium]